MDSGDTLRVCACGNVTTRAVLCNACTKRQAESALKRVERSFGNTYEDRVTLNHRAILALCEVIRGLL